MADCSTKTEHTLASDLSSLACSAYPVLDWVFSKNACQHAENTIFEMFNVFPKARNFLLFFDENGYSKGVFKVVLKDFTLN